MTRPFRVVNPGSVNRRAGTSTELTLHHLERRHTLGDIDKGHAIIVYCVSAGCPNAHILAQQLQFDGYTSVYVLDGGWDAWQKWSDKS